MKKIILLTALAFSTPLMAETKADGKYIKPTSLKSICSELEKSIVSYNGAIADGGMLVVSEIDKREKANKFIIDENKKLVEMLEKNLNDKEDRWRRLDCAIVLYSCK